MQLDTKGGVYVTSKSRADYFRERRKNLKQFVVMVDKKKFYEFDEKLKSKNMTKTKWLNEKIDEELADDN